MAEEITLSRQAYGKIFLHAAKYFDGVVIGYLLGQRGSAGTKIADVLPVCHANPAGPILDIAGDVVRILLCDCSRLTSFDQALISAGG
jgi:hypothetical protein